MKDQIQPYRGGIATQSFSGQSLATQDTIATVLAAREKAEVEARYIVAMKNPRDMNMVRRIILDMCESPGFAGSAIEKTWGAAWYLKPIGKGVEGFSIRFAEMCMGAMGNLDARSNIIWEDAANRLIKIDVVDLERNIAINKVVNVEKTIERKYLKDGEVAISVRENSKGEKTYLRAATADEVLQMQNSAESKAIRNGILRLVPVHILREARERILQIRSGDIAKDPTKAKRNIIDSFAAIGVKPGDLQVYLNHEVDSCTQQELVILRDLYKSIREGETNWHEVLTAVVEERTQKVAEKEKKEDVEKRDAIAEITAKLKGKGTDGTI